MLVYQRVPCATKQQNNKSIYLELVNQFSNVLKPSTYTLINPMVCPDISGSCNIIVPISYKL